MIAGARCSSSALFQEGVSFGFRVEAEQFEGLRGLLLKELGVEPGAETRKLYQELTK